MKDIEIIMWGEDEYEVTPNTEAGAFLMEEVLKIPMEIDYPYYATFEEVDRLERGAEWRGITVNN